MPRSLPIAAMLMLTLAGGAWADVIDPLGIEDWLAPDPASRPEVLADEHCRTGIPDHPLNLVDVVNLTLCRNPQTRAAWAAARVQAVQYGQSKSNYLPSVNLGYVRTQSLPGNKQRTLSLTLSYLLYDFGARAANLENAHQLLLAANATQDGTVQTMFLSAVQAYYQSQATMAALVAAKESERAAKLSLDAAEARYRAGGATPADRLQAQTAWSQSTLARITAEGSAKNAQGALANLLGLDANRHVALVETHTAIAPAGFDRDIDELIEEARLRRPDLVAAQAQVKAAEAGIDAARASGMPTLSLSVSNTRIDTAGFISRGSSLNLTANVPLFSGYGPIYRLRAAEAHAESQRASMEKLSLQVALDVWNAYQNLATATQSLRTSADLLRSAEQSERVARGRYQSGVGNMLDVLNAQSALASARLQRIQSTLDWNVSRATMAQAMGTLDDGLVRSLSAASRHENPEPENPEPENPEPENPTPENPTQENPAISSKP